MQEYIDFIGDNPIHFIALVIILVLIVKLEMSRITRKFKMINTNEAVKLMNNDDIVIVDVRQDKEIKDGVIKNSEHITLAQLTDRIGHLGSNKQVPVLVYCQTGTRSSSACNTIVNAGFENVSCLSGGITAWETANLPTVKR